MCVCVCVFVCVRACVYNGGDTRWHLWVSRHVHDHARNHILERSDVHGRVGLYSVRQGQIEQVHWLVVPNGAESRVPLGELSFQHGLVRESPGAIFVLCCVVLYGGVVLMTVLMAVATTVATTVATRIPVHDVVRSPAPRVDRPHMLPRIPVHEGGTHIKSFRERFGDVLAAFVGETQGLAASSGHVGGCLVEK
jgi:hypothetical protein